MDRSQNRPLSRLNTKHVEMGLALPCAIARWISLQYPHLIEKPHLNIIVAGAEWGSEVADAGRWYQFIPQLLGQPNMTVDIAIVGPGCMSSPHAQPDNPSCTFNKPLVIDQTGTLAARLKPASFVESTLGAFLRAGSSATDLVMLTHPNLALNSDSWLQPGEVSLALDLNIPVGVTSYGLEIFDEEVWVCDSYGFAIAGDAFENPFTVRFGSGTAIGSALWEISGRFHETPNPVATKAVAEYQEWSSNVKLSLAPSHHGLTGQEVIFNDGMSSGIFVPPNFIVDLDDGCVWSANHDLTEAFLIDTSINADLLSSFQREPLLPHETMFWVMKCSKSILSSIANLKSMQYFNDSVMKLAA